MAKFGTNDLYTCIGRISHYVVWSRNLDGVRECSQTLKRKGMKLLPTPNSLWFRCSGIWNHTQLFHTQLGLKTVSSIFLTKLSVLGKFKFIYADDSLAWYEWLWWKPPLRRYSLSERGTRALDATSVNFLRGSSTALFSRCLFARCSYVRTFVRSYVCS